MKSLDQPNLCVCVCVCVCIQCIYIYIYIYICMCIYLYSSVQLLSHVQLFGTPWTVAFQASLSMDFSMQEHWCVLLSPSPGDPHVPRIETGSPALKADSLPSEHQGSPWLPREPTSQSNQSEKRNSTQSLQAFRSRGHLGSFRGDECSI